jgi:hypothetical protein
LIKSIKNKKNIINIFFFINIFYNFTDSDDYIELNDLFNHLIKCKNYGDFYKYIQKIEQMIIELNGFQNYVLK